MRVTKRIPAKPAREANARRPAEAGDEAQFEMWLKDFDVRQAQLSAQLDAVLYSLGVNPGTERNSA